MHLLKLQGLIPKPRDLPTILIKSPTLFKTHFEITGIEIPAYNIDKVYDSLEKILEP